MLFEDVSYPVDRSDVSGVFGFFLYFATQMRNIYMYVAIFSLMGARPNSEQDLVIRYHPPRVAR